MLAYPYRSISSVNARKAPVSRHVSVPRECDRLLAWLVSKGIRPADRILLSHPDSFQIKCSFGLFEALCEPAKCVRDYICWISLIPFSLHDRFSQAPLNQKLGASILKVGVIEVCRLYPIRCLSPYKNYEICLRALAYFMG